MEQTGFAEIATESARSSKRFKWTIELALAIEDIKNIVTIRQFVIADAGLYFSDMEVT